MYLLDTNVISEYRKRGNAHRGVIAFFEHVPTESLFLPIQVIGEIQAGISKLRRNRAPRELEKANIYERWFEDQLLLDHAGRILEFDLESSRLWGSLLSSGKKDPHTIDKQIAAIAMTRDMTVVTRDIGEAFTRIRGLKVKNPFL
jgi:predicted nucleic acid-binding protein